MANRSEDQIAVSNIVRLATTRQLSPEVFSDMLRRGDVNTGDVVVLIQKKLLTPGLLAIWFSSYPAVPGIGETSQHPPFATIISALSSEELVSDITPEHLASLTTTNQRLLNEGVYTNANMWVHDRIETLLNQIKPKKVFRRSR